MTNRELQHFFWRAGFGISLKELEKFKNKGKNEIIDHLFAASKVSEPLDYDLSRFSIAVDKLSETKKKEIRQDAKRAVFELNGVWLKRMATTKAVLREKMTFFFHDHFACNLNNPVVVKELNEILRANALENFGTMLHKVAKSPAMINFLNNQQNKKEHPNENFAREVMELFTLGRDNGYTEKDVQEAARAFTGWGFSKEFKYVFKSKQHDFGEKTVLGQTGNFSGEEVLDLLLKDERTAQYLTRKIVTFLIGEHVPDSTCKTWASAFYLSNYALEPLLRMILGSKEFLADEAIGARIKSPTELIVGLSRLIPIDYQDPKAVIQLQRKLNQLLFFPPNVSGWTEGKGWIDSTTLLFRMKFPSIVLNYGEIEWLSEESIDENRMEQIENQREKRQEKIKKRVNAHPEWSEVMADFTKISGHLTEVLLQKDPLVNTGLSTEFTEENVVQILSLPEYQLC